MNYESMLHEESVFATVLILLISAFVHAVLRLSLTNNIFGIMY